ncbi:MAG TPA: hypothetical protein VGA18_02410, partial [Rhodothermales bacterium]
MQGCQTVLFLEGGIVIPMMSSRHQRLGSSSKHRVVAFAVIGFWATLCAVSRLSAATLHPPVPLHTPPLWVPAETAGSGVAPEAKVRVHLDDRGSVTQVEVLAIVPSTEFDSLFEKNLVATLLRWRYAPQIRDGVAEATTLDWVVRFPAKSERQDGAVSDGDPLPGANAEDLRSRILALPSEQRVALLNAQAGRASRLLEGQSVQTISSRRFVVHSDAPDPTVASVVAGNLEA